MLRAILQESEAKLEIKNFKPLQFLCAGRLPGGINKNNHSWIGSCIVAMVAALDHVDQRSLFSPKNSLSRSKNKLVWFSGARESDPMQMRFTQIVEPISQFVIKESWVL